MKRYTRYFKESIQAEKEISKLSTYVCRMLLEKIQYSIKMGGYIEYFDPSIRSDVSSYNFERIKYKNDFLYSFLLHLMNYNFKVTLEYNPYEKANSGIYITRSKKPKEILIYTEFPEFTDSISKKNIERFVFSYKTILDHELTHAYDDYITSGKYTSAKYTDEGDEYYQQNIEVNAYYTMAVNSIENSRFNRWEDYLKLFKREFSGKFEVLSKKQQQRLIDRLYKRWKEPLKYDRIDRLNNLSYSFLYYLESDSDLKKLVDPRIDISIKDMTNYAKDTLYLLLANKVNRKAFNSPKISENRFAYFKGLVQDIERLDDKYKKLNDPDTNEATKPYIQKMIDKEEKKFIKFKKFFKLDDDKFEKLLNNISKLK